jgi:hypothetical protein
MKIGGGPTCPCCGNQIAFGSLYLWKNHCRRKELSTCPWRSQSTYGRLDGGFEVNRTQGINYGRN